MSKQTKVFSISMLLLTLSTNVLFASGLSIAELDEMAGKVLNFFKSPFIISLVSIALVSLGVALLLNFDNEKLKKSLTGWLIAVAIIFGGPTIAAQFVKTSGFLF